MLPQQHQADAATGGHLTVSDVHKASAGKQLTALDLFWAALQHYSTLAALAACAAEHAKLGACVENSGFLRTHSASGDTTQLTSTVVCTMQVPAGHTAPLPRLHPADQQTSGDCGTAFVPLKSTSIL